MYTFNLDFRLNIDLNTYFMFLTSDQAEANSGIVLSHSTDFMLSCSETQWDTELGNETTPKL